MSNFYPYEYARTQSLTTLESKVFTTTGTIKKNAQDASRRFSAKHGLNYNDIWGAVQKNYRFYWNDYVNNNPKATKAEVLKAQNNAFRSSMYNRIAHQASIEHLSNAEEFIWLPSASDNPRDSDELKYGKTYTKDNPPDTLPAEKPNCQCGYKIIKYTK